MALKYLDRLTSYPSVLELFNQVDHETLDAIRLIAVRAGSPLFRNGEACENFLMLLEGSARVQRLSDSGQIITLYHLDAGRCCPLTLSCLLGGSCYPAEAVAETKVRALLLPGIHFREALAQSPQFRRFVFSAVDRGIQGLLSLVEEVSFEHMDHRLARCLLQVAHSLPHINVTHSALAEELGTAREVVSRLLKDFEHHGWVKLHRGCIEITNRNALVHISRQKTTVAA